MIELTEGSEGPVVGLRVRGTLRASDYEALLPMLEERFHDYGKLRVMFLAAPDFAGWDTDADRDDAPLDFAHGADFERVALVGAPDPVVRCVKLSAFLFKGEVRVFPADALNEAWSWLHG